jgi:hypothetical protein
MARLILHLLTIALGVFLLVLAGMAWADVVALAQHGVTTTATVVEKLDEPGSRGGRLYSITYVVTATVTDGHSMVLRENQPVSKTLFDQAQVGAPIPVRYLPSRPENNDILGNSNGTLGAAVPGAIFVVIGLIDLQRFRSGQNPQWASERPARCLFRRRHGSTISTESLRRLQRAERQRERHWR